MENMKFFSVSIYTPLIEITRDSQRETERKESDLTIWMLKYNNQNRVCEINWEIEREREGEIERAKNYFHWMTMNLHVEI